MTSDYVGYISYYYSSDAAYPAPRGEPGFAGNFWTWGRYGVRENEDCCRCRIREGLSSLIGVNGAPVYYITKVARSKAPDRKNHLGFAEED